jgi:hypothetical protein
MAASKIWPARGAIAVLQSAGMGGYGLAVVNGATRAVAAVPGLVRVLGWARAALPKL